MKQLRVTTVGIGNPYEIDLVVPSDKGELTGSFLARFMYLHGKAEFMAGNDYPSFIDGDLGQIDAPIWKQDILLLLPSGEYKCNVCFTRNYDKELIGLIYLEGDEKSLNPKND